MSTPYTVTELLGRAPTFAELQKEAKEFEIQISGDDQAGEFSHANANGKYSFTQKGGICGDFSGQYKVIKIKGNFALEDGNAEVSVTDANWPGKVAEGEIKSQISAALNKFCAKFPPLA